MKRLLIPLLVLSLSLPLCVVGCGEQNETPTPKVTPKERQTNQASRPHITGISVGANQQVLGPNDKAINRFGGLDTIADEHSTILPPGTVPGHQDYLFFLGGTAGLNTSNGMVVLSGGHGPDKNGQWTLDFAHDYGLYDPKGSPEESNGQVFSAPIGRTDCPVIADARNQDPTFDLNYASGGSVVIDPTNKGPRELLMVYEGTNRCIGLTGGKTQNTIDSFYASIGVATSSDYGRLWPFYRKNFSLQPKDGAQGPMAPEKGAFGSLVCLGFNGNSPDYPIPPASFGRYPVISPTYTIKEAIATGVTLSGSPDKKVTLGYQAPSAFVDDVNTDSGTYLYSVQNYGGDQRCPYSTNGLTVSRAKLNGGNEPLKFMNWYNGSFNETKIQYPEGKQFKNLTNAGLGIDGGGLTSPIFPDTPDETLKLKLMGSISYVDETKEYLLIFLSRLARDPAAPNVKPTGDEGNIGLALFYSTLDATRYDLSTQDKWSTPKEISGSFEWNKSNYQPGEQLSYNDNHLWYSTFMSLNSKPGHLSLHGFVFSMYGCTDGKAGHPREYTSRPFTIKVEPN